MKRFRMVAALALIYMVFAVLLNSVGTVILQSMASFGVDKPQASLLELFKDLPIAITSFVVASFLPLLGYRRAMMGALAIVGGACLLMPMFPGFHTPPNSCLPASASRSRWPRWPCTRRSACSPPTAPSTRD